MTAHLEHASVEGEATIGRAPRKMTEAELNARVIPNALCWPRSGKIALSAVLVRLPRSVVVG